MLVHLKESLGRLKELEVIYVKHLPCKFCESWLTVGPQYMLAVIVALIINNAACISCPIWFSFSGWLH